MMEDILSIGKKLGIDRDFIESYGKYMAKISLKALGSGNHKGKLILVTAMTPTKYGEGKTTTTIGLSQAFKKLGKKVSISIREPSMGPCFGVKGGARAAIVDPTAIMRNAIFIALKLPR